MPRIPYTSKHSASQCCACGQVRGETRQALVGRDPRGSIWLCAECAKRDTNRQTFLAAYVALMTRGPLVWDGEPVPVAREED